MDLATTYLGLNLRSPLVPSASPLSQSADNIKRMEDAGAAAVVLPSLFEEQLIGESLELEYHLSHTSNLSAEALSYFPEASTYRLGPDEYLKHISDAKKSVGIPVIGSLNGTTAGGWTGFAKQMEQAGADALELNVYYIPTDLALDGAAVEQTYVDILKVVKASVSIPVAVKLSPFFSNMGNMARRLDEAGADGLVLFNRFYQPDIDLDALEVKPNIILSTPQAMRLPLRWIAILYGQIGASLAATSGIHQSHDVLKMLMAGASITQVCSVLLMKGIEHLKVLEQGLIEWMEVNEYESVKQMQGSMSQKNVANPSAFERAQYTKALQTYVVD
ncbi:MAG TPA: dihydroorotate dehydrogenase-like protein [Armatimonadota bacterium]|jgi:dihydroorotate dehydrogenase (fumarate)